MRHDYDEIIRQLYAGILAPQGWGPALQLLRLAFSSEQSTFLVHDRVTGITKISEAANFDTTLVSDYEGHFWRIDPVRPVVETRPLGTCFLDRKHLGEGVVNRHPFYQEFMRRHGLTTIMCSALYRDSRCLAGIAFQGGVRREAFNERDARSLRILIPHLMQAARLRLQADKLVRAAAVGQIMLDNLAQAIFVIDRRGEMLFANCRALQWLRCVTKKGSGKAGGSANSLQSALANLSRRLCCRTAPLYAHAALRVSEETHHLIGLGLPEGHPLAVELGEHAALILVREEGSERSVAQPIFKEMFGLTASELHVTEAIQRHDRLTDLARELGITHETARTHLKSIFQKTGCHSQSALGRLWADITTPVFDTSCDEETLPFAHEKADES